MPLPMYKREPQTTDWEPVYRTTFSVTTGLTKVESPDEYEDLEPSRSYWIKGSYEAMVYFLGNPFTRMDAEFLRKNNNSDVAWAYQNAEGDGIKIYNYQNGPKYLKCESVEEITGWHILSDSDKLVDILQGLVSYYDQQIQEEEARQDTPMTPIQFHQMCLDIARDGGGEDAHVESDELMENLLISLGYEDGVNVLREMTRWYS